MKQGIFKKISTFLLGSILALGVGVAVSAPHKDAMRVDAGTEKAYEIEFTKGTNDSSTTAASISSGETYATLGGLSKAYARTNGMHLSSGSAAGSATLTMTSAGQVKASKLIVNALAKSNKSYSVKPTYTDNTEGTTTSITPGTTDHADEIQLNKQKTLKSIVFNASSGTGTGISKVSVWVETSNPLNEIENVSGTLTAIEGDNQWNTSGLTVYGTLGETTGQDVTSLVDINCDEVPDEPATNIDVSVTISKKDNVDGSAEDLITTVKGTVSAIPSTDTKELSNPFSATFGIICPKAVGYEGLKGSAANAASINSGNIRIFQNGGQFRVYSLSTKYAISYVKITTATGTTVGHKIDGGAETSDGQIAANGSIELSDLEASEVLFVNNGTTSSTRLDVKYLKVTYILSTKPIFNPSCGDSVSLLKARGTQEYNIEHANLSDDTQYTFTYDDQTVASVSISNWKLSIQPLAEGSCTVTIKTGTTTLATISINVTDSKVYEKVGLDELFDGAKVLIVGVYDSTNYYAATATGGSSSSGSWLTTATCEYEAPFILDKGSAVEFTVRFFGESIAFEANSKYVGATKAKYLNMSATSISDNSAWTYDGNKLTLNDSEVGSLRFNYNGGSPRFSIYNSDPTVSILDTQVYLSSESTPTYTNEADTFVYRYMHMRDYDPTLATKDTDDGDNECFGNTGYYKLAKDAFGDLSPEAVNALLTDSAYANAMERLSAWALANSDEFNTTTGTFKNASLFAKYNGGSSNGNLIVIVISITSVLTLGSTMIFRKRRD